MEPKKKNETAEGNVPPMKLKVHVQATVEVRRVGRFYLVGLPGVVYVKKTKTEAEAAVRRFFKRTARPAEINVGRIEWTEGNAA